MKKIVIAISGDSGSVYSKILLEKLVLAKDQWSDCPGLYQFQTI